MNRIKIFILNIIFLLIYSFPVYGWKSDIGSNHYPITEKAVSLITELKDSNGNPFYADISKFGKYITESSSGYFNGNDAEAHGKDDDPEIGYTGNPDALKYNGGPFEIWWKGLKEVKYPNLKFTGDQSAYYYIGLMSHLVEDQCVPVHAANISHGLDDKFEAWAWRGLGMKPEGGNSYKYSYSNPITFYFNKDIEELYPEGVGAIRVTQSKLTTWKYPESGDKVAYRGYKYWLESETNKYNGEKFDDNWGKYPTIFPENGGRPIYVNYDIYTHSDYDEDTQKYTEHNESEYIVKDQLNEAVSFVSGMLMAVSKRLPPLVKGLEIAPAIADVPEININDGNQITFDVMENRTQKVNIYITIDEPYVLPHNQIRNISIYFIDKLVKKEKDYILDASTDSNELPWKKKYTYTWNGTLADNKTYISDGEHTLYVVIVDQDGNTSSEISHKFKMPPILTNLIIAKLYYNSLNRLSDKYPSMYWKEIFNPNPKAESEVTQKINNQIPNNAQLMIIPNINGYIPKGEEDIKISLCKKVNNEVVGTATYVYREEYTNKIKNIDNSEYKNIGVWYLNLNLMKIDMSQLCYLKITKGTDVVPVKKMDLVLKDVSPPPITADIISNHFAVDFEACTYVFICSSIPQGAGGDTADETNAVIVGMQDLLNQRPEFYVNSAPIVDKIPKSEIKILDNGFGQDTFKYMYNLGIDADLVPIGITYTDLEGTKALIISTGGLYGINTPQIKETFKKYLENGGNIFVFTQSKKEDYEVMKLDSTLSTELDTWGYREDVSCWRNSLHINDLSHPILSGLERENIDVYVDGYLWHTPANSKNLLIRNANYSSGFTIYNMNNNIRNGGNIILTNMYEDWAMFHGQSTAEGRRIMQDSISWMMNSNMLFDTTRPSASEGTRSINISQIKIKNTSSDTTKYINLWINTPSGVMKAEKTIAKILAPDEVTEVGNGRDHSLQITNKIIVL